MKPTCELVLQMSNTNSYWENKHNTHSNALVFTKNEITNELNCIIVEIQYNFIVIF